MSMPIDLEQIAFGKILLQSNKANEKCIQCNAVQRKFKRSTREIMDEYEIDRDVWNSRVNRNNQNFGRTENIDTSRNRGINN